MEIKEVLENLKKRTAKRKVFWDSLIDKWSDQYSSLEDTEEEKSEIDTIKEPIQVLKEINRIQKPHKRKRQKLNNYKDTSDNIATKTSYENNINKLNENTPIANSNGSTEVFQFHDENSTDSVINDKDSTETHRRYNDIIPMNDMDVTYICTVKRIAEKKQRRKQFIKTWW